MKKTILTLTAAAAVMLSCDGTMSPSAYNEKAIGAFNHFSEKIATEREIVFAHELSKEKTEQLIAGMNNSIDSCMNLTAGLKYPEMAKDFHEGLIKVYSFSKDSIMPLLSETLKFEPESEEWYAVWRNFDKRSERVGQLVDEVGKLQEELAEKLNAKLQ